MCEKIHSLFLQGLSLCKDVRWQPPATTRPLPVELLLLATFFTLNYSAISSKQQDFLACESHRCFCSASSIYVSARCQWLSPDSNRAGILVFIFLLNKTSITNHALFKWFSNLKVLNMIVRRVIPLTCPVISVTLMLFFQQLDAYVSKVMLHDFCPLICGPHW